MAFDLVKQYAHNWLNLFYRNIQQSLSSHLDSSSPENTLRIVKLDETATIPTRAHENDAGYDLHSNENIVIQPGTRETIKTGLAMSIPKDCYGRVASRSGLSSKHCIDVGAGVIDCTYRDQISVVLINMGPTAFEVTRGMKIAQLICERIRYPEIVIVDSLDSTERGVNGFGSTGLY